MADIKIFLFRHGKTFANEKHLYCGKTDLDLSDLGKAELLSKKESGIYPDISDCTIYTSGLKRTNQTLQILYPELAERATTEKAFQEIDFGDFEMKSYDELKDNKSYQAWVQGESERTQTANADENPCPNGESWTKLNERVTNALKKIITNERKVAIFTHGGVISAILQDIYPNERKSIYEWQPDFGGWWEIFLEQGQSV